MARACDQDQQVQDNDIDHRIDHADDKEPRRLTRKYTGHLSSLSEVGFQRGPEAEKAFAGHGPRSRTLTMPDEQLLCQGHGFAILPGILTVTYTCETMQGEFP